MRRCHWAFVFSVSAAVCCQGNWVWPMTFALCGILLQSIFSLLLWKCSHFNRRQDKLSASIQSAVGSNELSSAHNGNVGVSLFGHHHILYLTFVFISDSREVSMCWLATSFKWPVLVLHLQTAANRSHATSYFSDNHKVCCNARINSASSPVFFRSVLWVSDGFRL